MQQHDLIVHCVRINIHQHLYMVIHMFHFISVWFRSIPFNYVQLSVIDLSYDNNKNINESATSIFSQ